MDGGTDVIAPLIIAVTTAVLWFLVFAALDLLFSDQTSLAVPLIASLGAFSGAVVMNGWRS